MWDLMRGKGSASTKLGKGKCLFPSAPDSFLTSFDGLEGETVRWSATGSSFVVQSQNTIDLFTVVSAYHNFSVYL